MYMYIHTIIHMHTCLYTQVYTHTYTHVYSDPHSPKKFLSVSKVTISNYGAIQKLIQGFISEEQRQMT